MENACGRHVRRDRRRIREVEREERVKSEDREVDRLLQAYERGRRLADKAEHDPRNKDEATFQRFEAFARLGPPKFNGESGFKAAEEWLASMKSRLEVCQAPPEQQVALVTYYLENTARFWWEGVKRGYDGDASRILWAWFEERFEQRFMGAVHREAMRTKFVTLKQMGRTVAEYNNQFLSLSQYAPDIINDTYRQRRQYLDGLDLDIAIVVDNGANQGLQALMDAAEQIDVYKKRRAQQHMTQTRNVRGRSIAVTGRKVPMTQTLRRTLRPVKRFSVPSYNWCNRCQLPHSESQCRYLNRSCFNCGSLDHWVKDCPNPRSAYQQKKTTSGTSTGYGYREPQRVRGNGIARGSHTIRGPIMHAMDTMDKSIQGKGLVEEVIVEERQKTQMQQQRTF